MVGSARTSLMRMVWAAPLSVSSMAYSRSELSDQYAANTLLAYQRGLMAVRTIPTLHNCSTNPMLRLKSGGCEKLPASKISADKQPDGKGNSIQSRPSGPA